MPRRRRLRLYEVSAADGVGALMICADAGRQHDFEVKSDGSGVDLAAGGRMLQVQLVWRQPATAGERRNVDGSVPAPTRRLA